jgi:mRNA interferase RelE/StbE
MPHFVEYLPSVKKQLDVMTGDIKGRISATVDDLEDNPRPPGCKKLKGIDDTYRIRVGDYRIVYEIHDTVLIVLVIRIAHRGKVYR